MNDGARRSGRKKILFGVTKAAWGGAQRYVFDIAAHLDSSAYIAVVMAGSKGRLLDLLQAKNIPVRAIDSLERDINPAKEISSFFEIMSVIRNERPDILHLNSPKMAGLGALAGRILGVPMIVTTIHGWSFGREWDPVTRAAIFLFSWVSALLAHRIICISLRDAAIARAMPFINKKVAYIPNGMRLPEYITKREARQKLAEIGNLPEDLLNREVWLGTITRFIKEKNLATMIRAMAGIDAPLFILGTGPEEAKLKALASGIAPDRIFFLGFVPDAEQYMKAFSLFLLSSIKEGLPYVLLEAAGAGVPIVATDVGGVPDIVSSGPLGLLVPPQNHLLFSQTIRKALQNQEEPARWSAAGPELLRRRFNLEGMLEETVKIYAS